MKTKYGNKNITFKFIFNEEGKDFYKILERIFKEEISNEKVLIGGKNELPTTWKYSKI